jgi:hypothetical protein
VHLQFSGRRRRVDALVQRHERNAECLEFLEQDDQVAEIAAQSIKSPHDNNIQPPPPCIGQQLVEGRSMVFRPADATVDVLHGCPTARGDVPTNLRELVLGLLIECADPGIDSGAHGDSPVSVGPRILAGSPRDRLDRLTG